MERALESLVPDSILTKARSKMKDPSESVISWILTNGGREMDNIWHSRGMPPTWMAYPEEEEEEEEEEDGEEEEEEDGEEEEEEDGEWRKYCEVGVWRKDPYETRMRKQMCVGWILAKNMLELSMLEKNLQIEGDSSEKERREGVMKAWREFAHKDLRARWKDYELERLHEISSVIRRNKVMDLEQTSVMKQQLKEAQEKGLQLDMELKNSTSRYLEFRRAWLQIHSCWGGVFEDITMIRSMAYTRAPAPKYVYKYGPPDTLQIFSVKVRGGSDTLQWPLHVFGLIALRDSVDQHRNVIFNRTRDDCQIITEKDPYLVLTGPTRAVVINEESIPVTIEAELKVKTPDGEKHLIFAVETVPSGFHSGWLDLTDGSRKIEIALERVMASVEATIFLRVAEGPWPTGFDGQLFARTKHCLQTRESLNWEVLLAEFGGDGAVTDNGNVEQHRFVVPVESSGELWLFLRTGRVDGSLLDTLRFKAERKGISFESRMIDSVKVEILVAWSPIRPVCEELVSMSDMEDAE